MPEYLKVLPYEVTRPKTWKDGVTEKSVVVSEKLDGEHVLLSLGQMYGRRKSDRGVYENKWDTLPAAMRAVITQCLVTLETRCGLDRTWVEGELLVEDGTSTDLKHCLLTESEHHRVKLVVFDCPPLRRKAKYADRLISMQSAGFTTPISTVFESSELSDEHVLPEEYSANKPVDGLEGYVVWENTKRRHPRLWKIKFVETYDVVCTGFKAARAGKYSGQVGALLGSWEYLKSGCFVHHEVCAASGMSDEVRAAITDADIGRAFEVTCNGFASKGRMRHPRFIRWRDDKPTAECTAPET